MAVLFPRTLSAAVVRARRPCRHRRRRTLSRWHIVLVLQIFRGSLALRVSSRCIQPAKSVRQEQAQPHDLAIGVPSQLLSLPLLFPFALVLWTRVGISKATTRRLEAGSTIRQQSSQGPGRLFDTDLCRFRRLVAPMATRLVTDAAKLSWHQRSWLPALHLLHYIVGSVGSVRVGGCIIVRV